MNITLPIVINLNKVSILVVGGGNVAFRKVKNLISQSNKIKIVSPKVIPQLETVIKENKLTYIVSEYKIEYLKEVQLCIAATDDKIINKNIVLDCNKNNILCNSISDPEEGHFIFPAFLKNKDLLIAVSTCGKVPALAAKIKNSIQKEYSDSYSSILTYLSMIKEKYQQQIIYNKRKDFWHDVINLAFTENYEINNLESSVKEILNKYKKTY